MLEESEQSETEHGTDALEPVATDEIETAETISEDTLTEEHAEAEAEAPSVDELQDRLGELQSAMDQLQAGDLDGAEATIASLEQAMTVGRQETGLT